MIERAVPLALAVVVSFVSVAAELISRGAEVLKEPEYQKRKALAQGVLLGSVPQSLCLAALSYDIWVVTSLFSGDAATLKLYNLAGKQSSIVLLIVAHVMLYLFVLGWGGVVRSHGVHSMKLEMWLAIAAIVLCVWFQVY